ncbi:MAG: hypothetical protein RL547_1551, partial [Actinomycetota bacterium]
MPESSSPSEASRRAKDRITNDVTSRADRLVAVSREIHARPELNYEEHFAHDLLCSTLEEAGLPVVRH